MESVLHEEEPQLAGQEQAGEEHREVERRVQRMLMEIRGDTELGRSDGSAYGVLEKLRELELRWLSNWCWIAEELRDKIKIPVLHHI